MRTWRLAAGLAVALAALAAAAPAQELSLAVSAGGFASSEEAYRDIYGSGLVLAADVLFKLKGPFGIATGFSRSADEGVAVPLDDGGEEYPLEFTRTTVPLLVFYQFDLKRIDIRLGAGLGFHSYKESWPTAGLSFEGKKTTPRFALDVGLEVLRRVSVFGSARYSSVRTGAGSPLVIDADVGGIEIMAGLAFRIF